MSQMLVVPHRFKKIGVHKIVVRRIFSDILLVIGLKKFEKHWNIPLFLIRKYKNDNITSYW
jgi:hypothetical protein